MQVILKHFQEQQNLYYISASVYVSIIGIQAVRGTRVKNWKIKQQHSGLLYMYTIEFEKTATENGGFFRSYCITLVCLIAIATIYFSFYCSTSSQTISGVWHVWKGKTDKFLISTKQWNYSCLLIIIIIVWNNQLNFLISQVKSNCSSIIHGVYFTFYIKV